MPAPGMRGCKTLDALLRDCHSVAKEQPLDGVDIVHAAMQRFDAVRINADEQDMIVLCLEPHVFFRFKVQRSGFFEEMILFAARRQAPLHYPSCCAFEHEGRPQRRMNWSPPDVNRRIEVTKLRRWGEIARKHVELDLAKGFGAILSSREALVPRDHHRGDQIVVDGP